MSENTNEVNSNEVPISSKNVTVPMHLSKKVSSIDGDTVLFYINTNYGLANKLESLMDFNSRFPTDEDFCIINATLSRVTT
jgi:arginine repressor